MDARTEEAGRSRVQLVETHKSTQGHRGGWALGRALLLGGLVLALGGWPKHRPSHPKATKAYVLKGATHEHRIPRHR